MASKVKHPQLKEKCFQKGDGTRNGTFSVKREMLNNKTILQEKRAECVAKESPVVFNPCNSLINNTC